MTMPATLPDISMSCLFLQPWGSCQGSSPGTRGYTCGLWLLFHTLAAHVTGDTGGALWMAAVKRELLLLCSTPWILWLH